MLGASRGSVGNGGLNIGGHTPSHLNHREAHLISGLHQQPTAVTPHEKVQRLYQAGLRKGLISEDECHLRDRRSVDETKEEDAYDTHPTTTSCSTDKENQDNNYSQSRLIAQGKPL